jgi:hypothetical protein
MTGPLHPETTGAALLEAAEGLLRREVIPALSGDARFAALMAAAAVGMAAREIARGGLGAPDAAETVEAIRAGRHDGDAAFHGRLLADAARRTAATRPAMLTAGERRLAGLPPA